MNKQQGFTLIEMMIVVGIIAILSAIGIPAYQNYLRKAALTDMLQTFVGYRTAIELCTIELGGVKGCNAGSNGIPKIKTTRYISKIDIRDGTVVLTGQQTLNGLVVTLTPHWDDSDGTNSWRRSCKTSEEGSLTQSCNDIFRFDENDIRS